MLSSEQIIQRIKNRLNIKSDAGVARLFNFHQANLRNWRERNTIAWAELYELCQKQGWSFDWLLTGKEGKGSCTLPPGSDEFCVALKDILTQTDDDHIKDTLRTTLAAFLTTIDKNKEKDRKIDHLAREHDALKKQVDYLMQLYDQKIQSGT